MSLYPSFPVSMDPVYGVYLKSPSQLALGVLFLTSTFIVRIPFQGIQARTRSPWEVQYALKARRGDYFLSIVANWKPKDTVIGIVQLHFLRSAAAFSFYHVLLRSSMGMLSSCSVDCIP